MSAPPIFDSHCDTIISVVDDGVDLTARRDGGHVDLPRLREGGYGLQVLACFADRMVDGDDVAPRARALVEAVGLVAEEPGFTIPRSRAELRSLFERPGGDVGVLPAIEGGDGLGGDPGVLEWMKARGVAYVTLAWGDTALCGGAFGDGRGLSALGVQVVREMEDLRILVDVSHASDAAFADIERVARRPFIASHSNARARCGSLRNLTDDQVRVIAERGGVIGVNFMAGLLDDACGAAEAPIYAAMKERLEAEPLLRKEVFEEADRRIAGLPRPALERVVEHIEHIAEVGGVGCVGFGSDWDGFSLAPEGLDDCRGYGAIVERLRARGWSEVDLEALCWRNQVRVFGDVLESGS